jgi:hypothetical protein
LLPAGAFAGWALHPLESAAFSRRTRLADVADPDPGRLNWAGCGRRPKARFGMETGLRRTGTAASIHAVATDGRRAAIMPSRISKYQIPVDVPHILC